MTSNILKKEDLIPSMQKEVNYKTAEWLNIELDLIKIGIKENTFINDKLLLLDCRTPLEFKSQHIITSCCIFLPELAMRRLISGRLPIDQLFKTEAQHQLFSERSSEAIILLYGISVTETIKKLALRLMEEIKNVFVLENGFNHFYQNFKSKCCLERCLCSEFFLEAFTTTIKTFDETYNQVSSNNFSNSISYNNLNYSTRKQLSLGESFSILKIPPSAPSSFDNKLPAEIITNKLFLGNMKHACDISIIQKYSITHILNVTNDQPNFFENTNIIKYNRLSLEDNSMNNVIDLLPSAFNFIDEAVNKNGCSILVHCMAGVSRSSTIVIAYLMARRGYTLDTAHDHVRLKKSDIWPNFGFMEQLKNLEVLKLISTNSDVQEENKSSLLNIKAFSDKILSKSMDNCDLSTQYSSKASSNGSQLRRKYFVQTSSRNLHDSIENNPPTSAPASGINKSASIFTFTQGQCTSNTLFYTTDSNKKTVKPINFLISVSNQKNCCNFLNLTSSNNVKGVHSLPASPMTASVNGGTFF